MKRPVRELDIKWMVPALVTVTALLFSACSRQAPEEPGTAAAAAPVLTLYSGQHENTAQALATGFKADTGIEVLLRNGKDGELANQIIEEGERSKADIFITEEPGPIGDLARRGLLVKIPTEILAKSDSRFVPGDSGWLPFAARSRVFYYNPTLIQESELPTSILELAKPEWKRRFAYAPSGAFRSTTAYLINTIGAERTLEWLKAIKENGVNEQKNGKVRDSVEAGQHAFGLSNHYYWYFLLRTKGSIDEITSRVHYLNTDDAGALLLASGAGIPKASANQELALRFIEWLMEPEGGQKVIAEGSPQFPLNKEVQSKHGLPTIDQLVFPVFDQADLNNIDEANELIKQAGII